MSILYQATNIAPEGIMEFCRNSLDADFLREDYLELVQLCLMYLDSKANRFSFRKPAAISRARWMAKVIYSLKIVLLSTQIQHLNIISNSILQELIRFTNFCVLVYVPWWITSPVASEAPINDLNFMQQLFAYADIDKVCSSTALSSLSRHLWYLTGELVPLCLFSSKIGPQEKQNVASKIVQHQEQVRCFFYSILKIVVNVVFSTIIKILFYRLVLLTCLHKLFQNRFFLKCLKVSLN